MTKTICDICGNVMPTNTRPGIIAKYKFCISRSYGKKAWDVCDDCRKKLNEWIKRRKIKVEKEE